MEDMKASLAMYFNKISADHVDDAGETDPKLIFGESWMFKNPQDVEAWSLHMIPFTNDIQFSCKFMNAEVYIKLSVAERIKDLECLNDPLIHIKCMTTEINQKPEDAYHFTLVINSKTIPFNLTSFLESLEPTEYRDEIKQLEVKIDRGEYKDRNGLPASGKRLCSKICTLFQDFSNIMAKLEAQKAMSTPRSVSRDNRPQGRSYGSLDTDTAGPSSSQAKPKRRSASAGPRISRSSPLASSSARRPTRNTSQQSEVAEANLVDAMGEVPQSWQPQVKPDFKHLNQVYQKFWTECEDAYVFGVNEKKDLPLHKLVDAPSEFNIREKEQKVVESMMVYLLNLLDRMTRQTICVMPAKTTTKPSSWDDIKDDDFWIINGQHSVAASKLITDDGSGVEEDVKKDFRVWSCFIVWSKDPEVLRSISAYYNRINHFQMIQPSWATNILGARKVWESMGCPENPTQAAAVGTPVARRAFDTQSRTKKFKVHESAWVDLIY